jgi:hypothetical protein
MGDEDELSRMITKSMSHGLSVNYLCGMTCMVKENEDSHCELSIVELLKLNSTHLFHQDTYNQMDEDEHSSVSFPIRQRLRFPVFDSRSME